MVAFFIHNTYICLMKQLNYSFIIPVYNRPNEIQELLESFLKLDGNYNYEIVIIEDGSTISSKAVIETFTSQLNISYYSKPNSGPGDSRNYGMQRAKGNYFIILDSDVILPQNYLVSINSFLSNNFYHCFGGPDAAHNSFSNLQKAINFAMTSVLTTGGIRGGKENLKDFQPRSFNMGLSKEAFKATSGFGKIHPGEDPDLVLRLRKKDFETTLITDAFVYHKRRISWEKFYKQVNKFGKVRPILNTWHPKSKKLTYWFPTVFIIGFVFALVLVSVTPIFLFSYTLYNILIFFSAFHKTKSISVAFMSVLAVYIQFIGYGFGFLSSNFKLWTSKASVETIFPNLFFK